MFFLWQVWRLWIATDESEVCRNYQDWKFPSMWRFEFIMLVGCIFFLNKFTWVGVRGEA